MLRAESVKVEMPGEPRSAELPEARPNEVSAIVEKIAYHGFVSHLYLRQPNGSTLIAFQQNDARAFTPPVEPGRHVRAYWSEDSNQVVRDE